MSVKVYRGKTRGYNTRTLAYYGGGTYTVTTGTDHGPIFVFQGPSNYFGPPVNYTLSGNMTISMSVNPGVNNTFTTTSPDATPAT